MYKRQVLVNDCGSGVMRHADAGYELAVATAKRQGLKQRASRERAIPTTLP